MSTNIQKSADVDSRAIIGEGSSVWHLAQIRENAQIGKNCVIGRGAYIGPSVLIGDNVKIQNLAQIYDPAVLGSGVFIGPGAILTNDVYPRATEPSGELKGSAEWETAGVAIGDGASIGARAVVLAGVTIGPWALIGAGAVVIRDVQSHALVVGNPAKQKGWVSRLGVQLKQEESGLWTCPKSGEEYEETGEGTLVLLKNHA
jgi:UDP-2-acetamido-3-amino-2,3-dideoxy-glucuronate N-acetyltransferase